MSFRSTAGYAILLALVGTMGVAADSAAPVGYTLRPEKRAQTILGLGFEIQSDSIGSGNQGLPDHQVSVPHDLVPLERQRFYRDMLHGFRYCRLAGGLYWRGLDTDQKFLRPRWPEQLSEIREMLDESGIEGVSFEYWSPAPYWKANRSYASVSPTDPNNTLRCFGSQFADDPDYKGDTDRFLGDFAKAVVADISTLESAGIPVRMWGLQNEPWVSHVYYSTCAYPDPASYVKAFRAVASAVRAHKSNIMIFGDTEHDFPGKLAVGMSDPEVAKLVDAYAVHTIGRPSENVREVDEKIRAELPSRPWFQNEYEYLTGGATPERCLNTVQHIMNSFQLAGNPTWFWIHALKPFKNAEASGYALGFWKSLSEQGELIADDKRRRWRDGPEFAKIPAEFEDCEMIVATRGDSSKPGTAYDFQVNQDVTVYLVVETKGGYQPGAEWESTKLSATRGDGEDAIYRRSFPAGKIAIPGHSGEVNGMFGAPHAVFVQPSAIATFHAMIGSNMPILIRSEFLALQREAARLEPGHWMFNRYNWNAVGSFVKRLPWNSTVIAVDESHYDADARILAFERPNGKLTIVVSNRGEGPHDFAIETGRGDSNWSGYRYCPEDAGDGTLGVPQGSRKGSRISIALPHYTWGFWEEQ